MTKVLLVAALLAAVPTVTPAAATCSGPIEVEHATIVRVERNGALILRDGRAAHLEGIRLPLGAVDRAPQFFADQAIGVLRDLAVGHTLRLAALAPKEDRYDRIRAQAFDGDVWLQGEILRRGMARVDIKPDRVECAAELFAVESGARAAHSGLWASPAYAVRNPSDAPAYRGTFQLVEGLVRAVNTQGGTAWLEFGYARRRELSAVIAPEDMRTYRDMGVNPNGYADKRVIVRGIVEDFSGPVIAVAHPLQVEVLPNP